MTRTASLASLGAALILSACAGGADGGLDRITVHQPPVSGERSSSLAAAEYLTHEESFAELQRAALAADYEAFARGLRARDPDAVVAQLTEAFGGDPFDAYTLDAETSRRGHRRAVELRGPADRLYLYLELDRSGGGWTMDEYELVRDRNAVTRRL